MIVAIVLWVVGGILLIIGISSWIYYFWPWFKKVFWKGKKNTSITTEDYAQNKEVDKLRRIKANLIHFRRELNWILYLYTHDLFGNLDNKLKKHELLEGEEFKDDISVFDEIYGYYNWEYGYAIRKYDAAKLVYPFNKRHIEGTFAKALGALSKIEKQINGFPMLLELNDEASHIMGLSSEIDKYRLLLNEWSTNKNIDKPIIDYYGNDLVTLGTKIWTILKAINNEIEKIPNEVKLGS